jgi:hypothetical protein
LGAGKTPAGEAKNLISHLGGTAICGGSAIAAIAPITNASQEEIAVSLGTVFVLNSVALLTFPAIGTALHMTQPQFGLWAALAIHDISSVVGATAKYGAVALTVGTTVKLARALWIVPLSVGTAMANKSKARIQWPWFILFFCLAAVANTYVHIFQSAYPVLKHLGGIGLTVTLFPDWNRTLHEDSPRGRGSTIPSGNPSLALRRGGIAYTHPRRLDSSVSGTLHPRSAQASASAHRSLDQPAHPSHRDRGKSTLNSDATCLTIVDTLRSRRDCIFLQCQLLTGSKARFRC